MLLLFFHGGVSKKQKTEIAPSADGASSEKDETEQVNLVSEWSSGVFDCKEGYHFEPHIGCTTDEEKGSVSHETRALVMALAMIFGVGVPCLVFVGLCALWDVRKMEREGENDFEAKSKDTLQAQVLVDAKTHAEAKQNHEGRSGG